MPAPPVLADDRQRARDVFTLIYVVFAAGLCSIIYELLIATTVVYFIGDSVRWFSLTIGLYMAAMGLGAYVSKLVTGNLMPWLILTETALGLAGGLCVPLLYLAHVDGEAFLPMYGVVTLLVGVLIGLEVPFLTRILEQYDSLRVSIAHVLSLDYLGALVATIAFPLALLPLFGIFRSGLYFGLVNMTIGLLLVWRFGDRLGTRARHWFRGASVAIVLVIVAGLVSADFLLAQWNQTIYGDRIVHAARSKYQELVLTRYRDDLRLYLNGSLQFSTIDEFRYHEALIHVPMAYLGGGPQRKDWDVLVLGGGDGLAVRELLRHPTIARITLVDLDPAVLDLARNNPHLRAANQDALTRDARVRVLVGDAMTHLTRRASLHDLIVADLPDPASTDTAHLYTTEFYRLVRANLAPGGLFVTQAASPFHAREAFWTIHATLGQVFPVARPYHLLVPSFGDWGFVLAGRESLTPEPGALAGALPAGLRFLKARMIPSLFLFGGDVDDPGGLSVSTLDRPVVLERYLAGWRYWGN